MNTTPTFLIEKTKFGKHQVRVTELKPDGTKVFRSDVGTVFPTLNTASNRLSALFPGGVSKIIRI